MPPFSFHLVDTLARSQRIVTYLIANRTLVNVAFFVSEYEREGEILPDAEHVTSGVDTSGFVQVSVWNFFLSCLRMIDLISQRYFSHWEREAQVIIEVHAMLHF